MPTPAVRDRVLQQLRAGVIDSATARRVLELDGYSPAQIQSIIGGSFEGQRATDRALENQDIQAQTQPSSVSSGQAIGQVMGGTTGPAAIAQANQATTQSPREKYSAYIEGLRGSPITDAEWRTLRSSRNISTGAASLQSVASRLGIRDTSATGTGGTPSGPVPTPTPTPSPAPTGSIDAATGPGGQPGPLGLSEFLAEQNVPTLARQFALGTGISPMFRNIVERQAGSQLLPFFLQQGQNFAGGGTLDPSQFGAEAFQNFLGQGNFQRFGEALQGARNVLGGSADNPFRQLIENELFVPDRLGAQALAPIISGLGRDFRGSFGSALQTTLENIASRDPTRFQDPRSFIDFLAQSRII